MDKKISQRIDATGFEADLSISLRYFGLSDRNRYRRETQCFQGFAAFLFATNRKIGFDFRTTKEKAPILCATKIDTA